MGKYDSIILKIFVNKRGIDKSKVSRLDDYPNIKRYIETRYSDSFSIEETLRRLQHNIETKPVCPCCGKPLKYIGKKDKMFQKYCSNSCRSKLVNKFIWIEGQKKYNLEHYGVEYNTQTSEFKKKRTDTLKEKYGDEHYNNIEQRRKTNLELYGVENYCNYEKRNETMRVLYGSSTFNNVPKRCETIKARPYQKYSAEENTVYDYLSIKYPNIVRQYTDERYPFNCDFYVPEEDLFIEYHGSHFHNGHPFDIHNQYDIEELNKLRKLANESTRHNEGKQSQYDMMIYTWTDLDVRKREIAKQNKLNYIVFYNISEVYDFIVTIQLQHKVLEHEYKLYCKETGSLTKQQRKNNIIKYFQQDTFYKVEKELWRDENIRKRLILNRQQYLNKFNLSTLDILNGFKRSGIYYGYSHFNPLWFKWFITEYNIKTCYDPCGGWGHRLLGSTDLDLYIYNDLSTSTYNNVNRIIEYFNIHNTVTYNNDAKTFIPTEHFEAMFTCPPYFNVEEYECGTFNNIEEYYSLIDGIFDIFYRSNNCKIFGLVIREDMLQDKYKYKYRFNLNVINQSHLTKYKQYKEYLYVFMKGEQ